MKKLTFLVAALCATMAMSAAEVVVTTCDFTAKTAGGTAYNNTEWEYGKYTLAYAANNNGGWAYMKFGAKNSTTGTDNATTGYIKTPQISKQIDKIVVNFNAGNLTVGSCDVWGVEVYSDASFSTLIEKVTGGTMTAKTEQSLELVPTVAGKWAANSYYKVFFECHNTTKTNGVVWVNSVEFKEEVAGAPEDPTFSLAEGLYTSAQSVELTCKTEGASIYYTLDGSTPDKSATLYSAAIPVSKTTTIKAVAIKDDIASSIVSATYTFPEDVKDLATFISKADKNNNVRILSKCVVTYQLDAKNVYIQDETAGILIYDNSGSLATYSVGDRLTGIIGKYAMYSGQNELVPALEAMPTPVAGEALTPAALTIPDVVADIQNQYIKLSSVSFKADATFTKGTAGDKVNITDGTNELVVYNKFKIMDGNYAASKKYDIVGIAIDYQGTKESYIGIYPISVTEQSTTAIETVEMSNIYAHSGRIYGAEQGRIYTINGMDVTEQNGQLSNGIYIVKVGAKATKIAVK